MSMRRFRASIASPTDLAVALLLVMIGVSVIVSPLPSKSWAALPPLALGLLLYLCLAKLPSANRLVWVGRGLAAAMAPISFITPFGLPRHISPVWTRPWHTAVRLPQTFNPNVIAGTLVLLLPFGAIQIWSFRSRHTALTWLGRGTWLMITGISLWLLWRTRSRGAHSAVVVMTLMLATLTWPKIARWLAVPIIAIGLLAGAMTGWRQIIDALFSGPATHGLNVRMEIWAQALGIARDFPLTGVGLGCFESVVAALYPLTLVRSGTVSHAHNLFLQVAMDLGLPGLIAYLAILGLSYPLTWMARQELMRRSMPELHGLTTACLLALTGMVVHGIIDSAVWGNKGAFFPWVVMGLGAGLYRYITIHWEETNG
jgi:putative inorganic carbon (hco3(-)) transporter